MKSFKFRALFTVDSNPFPSFDSTIFWHIHITSHSNGCRWSEIYGRLFTSLSKSACPIFTIMGLQWWVISCSGGAVFCHSMPFLFPLVLLSFSPLFPLSLHAAGSKGLQLGHPAFFPGTASSPFALPFLHRGGF